MVISFLLPVSATCHNLCHKLRHACVTAHVTISQYLVLQRLFLRRSISPFDQSMMFFYAGFRKGKKKGAVSEYNTQVAVSLCNTQGAVSLIWDAEGEDVPYTKEALILICDWEDI